MIQRIDREKLEAMNGRRHEDFVLINVLPPEEFNQEHIRTSVNVPQGDPNFTDMVEKVAGNKERPIVVYCAGFDCPASSDAAKKLDEAGFQYIYDYEGGTEDWRANH